MKFIPEISRYFQIKFVGTRSTFAMSLCETELVSPSSQEMVTSLQDVPITVPRSVVVAPQQTRSSGLRSLDWSPVIVILGSDYRVSRYTTATNVLKSQKTLEDEQVVALRKNHSDDTRPIRSPRDRSTRKPLETGCSFWVRVIMVIAHSPYVFGLKRSAALQPCLSARPG
jgi:hypothetical protein